MPLAVSVIKGLACPTVICDHCGKPISKREGKYAWLGSTWDPQEGKGRHGVGAAHHYPDTSAMHFLHYFCVIPWDDAHPGQWWCCMELDALPHLLKNNLGLSQQEADAAVELFALGSSML